MAVNDAALVTDMSELEYRELLVPIVRDGSAVAPRVRASDARERVLQALDHLDAAFKRCSIRRPTWWVWNRAWQVRDSCARTWPRHRHPGRNDPHASEESGLYSSLTRSLAYQHSIGLTYDDFL